MIDREPLFYIEDEAVLVDMRIDLRRRDIRVPEHHLEPHLPQRESELLLRINQGLPDDTARRYRDLISRRRTGTLSPEEHEELLRLTDRAEVLEADRLAHLAELARLRHTSLSRLMEELGIQPATDA